MRLLGFGSLVWICTVLFDKMYTTNTKLRLIHVHTVNRCYLFLFIVRLLIVGIIFSKYWWIFSFLLGYYLSISLIIGQDHFQRAYMEWEDNDEATLYDYRNLKL
jgi:hypothetical protein